jgi:hypothetical protein
MRASFALSPDTLESLQDEYPQGLKGCNDKQHDDKQRAVRRGSLHCSRKRAMEPFIAMPFCLGEILARRLRDVLSPGIAATKQTATTKSR